MSSHLFSLEEDFLFIQSMFTFLHLWHFHLATILRLCHDVGGCRQTFSSLIGSSFVQYALSVNLVVCYQRARCSRIRYVPHWCGIGRKRTCRYTTLFGQRVCVFSPPCSPWPPPEALQTCWLGCFRSIVRGWVTPACPTAAVVALPDLIQISAGKPLDVQAWQANFVHSVGDSGCWNTAFLPLKTRARAWCRTAETKWGQIGMPYILMALLTASNLLLITSPGKWKISEGNVFALRASCYYSASGVTNECLRDLPQNMHTLTGRRAEAFRGDQEGKRRR